MPNVSFKQSLDKAFLTCVIIHGLLQQDTETPFGSLIGHKLLYQIIKLKTVKQHQQKI